MKPLLTPSSHSNLYRATMRSPSFGMFSRNQITRLDFRERMFLQFPRSCYSGDFPTVVQGAAFAEPQWQADVAMEFLKYSR